MKHLHFDIVSGISGDMAVGALLHLGASLDPLREAFSEMKLPEVSFQASMSDSQGISALRFVVSSTRRDPHHRSWRDIRDLLAQAHLSTGAQIRALSIFEKLAEAEAKIHGTSPEEVVFHEIGAIDSIADIVGCALALEHFGPDLITSSFPLVGRGITQSQHGPIPLPAPATLELLRGIPLKGLDVESELTTPTGAAILASQVQKFVPWPDLKIVNIGYGAGSVRIAERPNILRVILGESTEQSLEDEILVEANIDNLNPEFFEYLLERLFAGGAHDAWLQPIVMKKSRPAVILALLCNQSQLEQLERILFTESTTIGVRRQTVSRRKLERHQEQVTTPFGMVRIKIAGEGNEIWTASPEFEDCRVCAREAKVPLKTVYQTAIEIWKSQKSHEPKH